MEDITYSISARGKSSSMTMRKFFRENFSYVDKECMDMVFGFVEPSPLYGGRPYEVPEITDNDLSYMYAYNIGFKIPLSNHFVTEEEYEQAAVFLEKYHRKGNGLAVVNDDLAKWVRRDFPLYEIEASVIKNINTQSKVDKALMLYDIVVLPMNMCLDHDSLKDFDAKEKIRLFANGGCAINCPAPTCYRGISKVNKLTPEEGKGIALCSQTKVVRESREFTEFDIGGLISLGYSKFKLLYSRRGGPTATGY